MRQYAILLVLGLLLVFIAWQARTGVFRRENPGEPANKYVRQMQEAKQLAADEAALIADKFPGAIVTPSGLRYIVRAPGEGSPPPVGARVEAHFLGTLLTGQKFDSTYDQGRPIAFRVGLREVIRGWDEAFAQMKRGERRTLIVPWWLAYGREGRPPKIPPQATLVFEVELVDFH